MLDGSGLEPHASASKFIGYYSHTVKVRIVEVDLIVWVSPSIPDSYSLKTNPCIPQKSIVIHEFASKGGNIMSGKGLPSDIKRNLPKAGHCLYKLYRKFIK